MKKFILLFLILTTIINTKAQTLLDCEGVAESPYPIDESIYYNRTPSNDKYVFNVFFHIIRDDNGNPVPTDANTLQDAIALLNISFNDFNIFFKYRGYDYIDDSSLLNIEYDSNDPNNNEYSNLVNHPQYRAYEISYVAQSALAVGWPYYWVSLNHFGYKFQKGFDYELYTWDYDWVLDNNNQLVTTNYTYSAFPYPYFTINRFDLSTQLFQDGGRLAIKIIQVDNNNIVPILSSINPIPGPAVTSTTLISSDVNTNNMTVRELDEQESNDPNLIQDLEPGKVHRIIKHLDNGENDTKTIYKEN